MTRGGMVRLTTLAAFTAGGGTYASPQLGRGIARPASGLDAVLRGYQRRPHYRKLSVNVRRAQEKP